MPKCCEQTKILFSGATQTAVTYDDVMRNKYGTQPRVYVYYFDDVTGEYYLSPFFSVMKFDGNTITVDHGGPMNGMLVIT